MKPDWNVKGFIKTSLVDWPGKICSVIFLPGCTFRCPVCHNADLVVNPAQTPDYPQEEVFGYLASRRKWIDGVTITGGEPTLTKQLPDLARALKQFGFKVKLDTNGSRPAVIESLLSGGLIDAVYMDVKAPLTKAEYSRVAGVSVDMKSIKASLALLKSSSIEVVFRTTVIPGLVQEAQLAAIRSGLGSVQRFIIQPYKNEHAMNRDFRTLKEFSARRIEEMRAAFESPMSSEELPKYAAAG